MRLILIILVATLTISASDCNQKKEGTKLKGRLEIKGICSNYTISLLDGQIDTSMIAGKWTDETTGKEYSNVFALGNPCSFPKTLQQGDEFYFRIDTAKQEDCIVCMAYYPKPVRALNIRIEE